jgi:uncharacterized damage-inducible protein DinB
MALALTIDEFLGYTEEERAKWEEWFSAHPEGFNAMLHRQGRFSNAWSLIDHIFLVERRHTLRLRGQDKLLPESTGVSSGDGAALFAYGRSARAALVEYLRSVDPMKLTTPIVFRYLDKTWELSARKLIFHIQMHEVRHWAQIATAIRNAGYEPPGFHDLLFANAMK